MASIVLLKHKPSDKTHSFFTVDARELLSGAEKENWEFVRRLERGTKMIERGIAAKIDPGTGGALEYFGERTQLDAAKAASQEAPIESAPATAKQRGQRGGGPQEPAAPTAE